MFQQLHVEDESSDDYENLFEKFQEMKGENNCSTMYNVLIYFPSIEKASQLQGNERLIFAEKTALAFWKAMGGRDEDEDQEPDTNAT